MESQGNALRGVIRAPMERVIGQGRVGRHARPEGRDVLFGSTEDAVHEDLLVMVVDHMKELVGKEYLVMSLHDSRGRLRHPHREVEQSLMNMCGG